MGGSNQPTQQISNNSAAETQLAQTQATNSAADRALRDKTQAPAISLYSALTSGDPTAAMTAGSPLIAPIAQGYQASKDSIFNNVAPGAGRDAALAQLTTQKNAATAGVFSNETAGAYDKLANIGSGLGAFSLQDIGASANLYGGSTAGYNDVAQVNAQNKASTMGFLGSLAGAGGAVGAAKLCWIAEAIYGLIDPRVDILRAWLNGPYSQTHVGAAVMWLYGKIGREVAWAANRSSLLRAVLRPLFNAGLARARAA